MIVEWPSILKIHEHIIPKLEKNVSSSGPSLSGQEDVVVSDAGFWRYRINTLFWDVKVQGDVNRLAAWISFIDNCQVRANRVRVPILCNGYDIIATSGKEALRSALSGVGVPHSDTAFHSDGSGYDQSICSAVVVARVQSGATSMLLNFPSGFVPQNPNPFSNGDSFYRIKTATLVSGTIYEITFLPRLRQACGVGAEFSFDKIFCLMRLTDEAATLIPQDPTMVSSAQLDFNEALV